MALLVLVVFARVIVVIATLIIFIHYRAAILIIIECLEERVVVISTRENEHTFLYPDNVVVSHDLVGKLDYTVAISET